MAGQLICRRDALIASDAFGVFREPDLLQPAVGELAKQPGGLTEDNAALPTAVANCGLLRDAEPRGGGVCVYVGAEEDKRGDRT